VIGARGDRLAHLVQALVDVGQVRSGKLTLHRSRFDLCGLARDVASQVQVSTERHQLSVTCEGQAEVEADRVRIGGVIYNLLDNAVKYSPTGGPVEVTVQVKEGEVVVCVRDHGRGIPREKQAQLFEAFYQVAPMMRPTSGMGLGLCISREIVHRHGGRIWLTSVEGEGSTFCFSLPRSP
jgi:signal transduction histidine kinase